MVLPSADWLAALDAATDYRALFADQFGPIIRETGEEGWARCPVHDDCDDTGKFSFNTRTGVWKCHKTDEGGNLLSLLKKRKPKSWRDEWVRVCPNTQSVFGTEPKHEQKSGSKGHNPPPAFSELCRDKQRETTDADLQPLADAWKVGVPWLRDHGWFVMTGGHEGSRHPKYCVPIYDGDNIVGVRVRFLPPYPLTKVKDGEEPKPIKSKLLFGSGVGLIGGKELTRLVDGKPLPVLVVEGEKDWAVACHDYGHLYAVTTSSHGCKVMREEMARHMASRDVTVLYDEDEAGNEGSKIACLQIHKVAKQVRQAHIGVVGKDTFNLLREDDARTTWEAALAGAVVFDPVVHADVRSIIRAAIPEEGPVSVVDLGKHIFKTLADSGALWLHTKSYEAYCIYDGRSYAVNKTDPGWAILVGEWTGIDATSGVGSRLHAQMRALACESGVQVERSAWYARVGDTLFLPLYDREQHLVRITADSITMVKNGHEGAVVMPNSQVAEIEFTPDDRWDIDGSSRAWERTWRLLNCTGNDQHLIAAWVTAMPLFAWSGTHALTRFTGGPGSGKSMASKIITTLIYGDEQLLKSTNAALFRIGTNSPLIALDNVEAENVDPNLEQFFLLAATGIERAKSMMDDPTQTVREKVASWILTTGIEPLGSGKRELQERTVTVTFGGFRIKGFYEDEVLKQVKADRNLLWNYMFRMLQYSLQAIRDGALSRLLMSMPQKRERLREFYALLSIASGYSDTLDPVIAHLLDLHAASEEEETVEDNPLVELIAYLPIFLTTDQGKTFGLSMQDRGALWKIEGVQSVRLSSALSAVARSIGKQYPFRSVQQLTTRIGVSRDALEAHGFKLTNGETNVDGTRKRAWNLEIPKNIGKHIGELFEEPNG